MGVFCIHPFGDETETLPDPEDVSIHWKGVSSQTEEKEAMNRLRTDPFQGADRSLDVLGFHLSQKGKAQFSFLSLDPKKNLTDALRLLFGQPALSDG